MVKYICTKISYISIALSCGFIVLATACSSGTTSDTTAVTEDIMEVNTEQTESAPVSTTAMAETIAPVTGNSAVTAETELAENTVPVVTENMASTISSESLVVENNVAENTLSVTENLSAQELPVYDSAPTTAVEFADWLRTSTIGEENMGGWSCYANTLTSEVGWSGLYFSGANSSAGGTVSEARNDRGFLVSDPVGYLVTGHNTVDFSGRFIWSDARFTVSEESIPFFSADDSRGFRVTCWRTNGVPEYA